MDADVLVVGAGLAGAAAARALSDSGQRVVAFDKGRGPGGRLSTRRTPSGSFDHGAASLQATTPAFGHWLASETTSGRMAPWRDGHVGVPGMSAVVAGLLEGVDVRWSMAVASLRCVEGAWHALDADGRRLGSAAAVVLAIPAPQAVLVLRSAAAAGELPEGPLDAMARIRYSPCWAGLVQTVGESPGLRPGVDPSGMLEAIHREADKPGRPDVGHWVVHATASWSTAHLESSADAVATAFGDAFVAATGVDPSTVRSVLAHRWRYARPLEAWNPEPLETSGLVLAGDAFNARALEALPPAERAWLSGRAAAERVRAARQPKS